MPYFLLIFLLCLNNVACMKIIKIEEESSESNTQTTSLPETKPTKTFANIKAVGVYRVAAYLAELGYFQAALKQAQIETVKAALKLFQQDIKVEPTGLLDDVTWNKLQSVKLNRARQAELEAITTGIVALSHPIDPALPQFTLKTGESVFVIDRMECKSKNEMFVLFYEGQLQKLQHSQVQVNVNKRYALWYDRRREGVSKTDWWCIPRKRFCYSSINFTDWRGTLKISEVGLFEKKLTIPSRFDIASLVAHESKRACAMRIIPTFTQ